VFGLIVAGLQVPLIPLGDVVANVGTALPWQIGEIVGKLGVVNVAQGVLHVTVIGETQATPLACKVKVTEVPGLKPVTV
jgi:hypothetical protein